MALRLVGWQLWITAMSLLTEALNRILKWKQKHFPSQVSLLQPGLSDAEINQITQGWSIKLPTEVRELYKWRNGSRPDDIGEYAWIFDGFTFLPLFQKGLIETEDNERRKLLNDLRDSDENIKRTVAFLLFMLNAVDALIQSLKNNDAGIRRESAWALGQIGDSRAAEPLIEALQDSDADVREAAREAWEKLILKSPEISDIIPF
ncbi:HEAT repeat domain-containing protein [Chlorogloeopsis sp. ULAP02]|uniref:HEAT repeat domain-containing protein n=1 Tax=Chlorogloeopsis sp. ULAP02 TaxID=3107926 RepID=UPI003134B83D